jgi:hypothetical protein
MTFHPDWTESDWPDWQDAGKRVEVEYDDGSTVIGTLTINDFHFNGEDETPEFSINADDGTEQSFVMNRRWRFL